MSKELATSDAEALGIDLQVLSAYQKEIWDTQEKFLSRYELTGARALCARATGISLRAVEHWITNNNLEFVDRIGMAREFYTDTLEEGLMKAKHPVAYIAKLNAWLPEKYRPNVVVADDSAAKDMIKKLGQGAKKQTANKEEGEGTEGKVTSIQKMRRKASG